MSTSGNHSSPVGDPAPTIHPHCLVRIALDLAATGEAGPAAHVVVSTRPGLGHEADVERHALPCDDPVVGLVGRRASPQTAAVGLVGPSWLHPLDHAAGPASGVFVHLIDTTGTSVTVVAPTLSGATPHVVGPTPDIQQGRVADACRRILGLPTSAPPPDTTDLLVDDWLERSLSTSMTDPHLDWADLLGCHPLLVALGLTREPWTPSMLARATQIAGRAVGWESIRVAHLAEDRPPSSLPKAWLAWMDAGMFARWVRGEALARSVVLDALDATLRGPVHDRLTATLSLLSTGDDGHLRRS